MNRPKAAFLVVLVLSATLMISCKAKKVDCPAYGKQTEQPASKTA